MKPFRDLAPVVAEMVGPMPYPALNSAFDALYPKGIRAYWKGNFVTELTDAAIEAHLAHGPKVPEVSATMHLYPINGACHRVAADDTAFAYRDANFATVILASWSDPAVDAERIQWVRDYYARHRPPFRTGRLHQLHGRRRRFPDQGQLQGQLRPAGGHQATPTTPTTSSISTKTSLPEARRTRRGTHPCHADHPHPDSSRNRINPSATTSPNAGLGSISELPGPVPPGRESDPIPDVAR